MLISKALHIIFVVTWFSGLFYIVRLFVYHAEAEKKDENEKAILQNQYKLMEKRLWYGITWPSMILNLIFGILMLYFNPSLLKMPFIHLKLGFVFLLIIYHFLNHQLFRQFQSDEIRYSSFKLRLWNEVATLFLVSIVFIIVMRDLISWLWAIIGIIALGFIFYLVVKKYKNIRERREE